MAMPPQALSSDLLRKAVAEANSLIGILQGTMSLEGQGLDKGEMRQVKKRMIRRLLQVTA